MKAPTEHTAKSFGVSATPVRIPFGQGASFRAGPIVLKAVDHEPEALWLADLFATLPVDSRVRFARPVKSSAGAWALDGYVAWQFLEGASIRAQYAEKIAASLAFHELIGDIEKPAFLKQPHNSWEAANRVAWQERESRYTGSFLDLIEQVIPRLRPVSAPRQVVHGDLSGNFLLGRESVPAIIDMSPTWAPRGFAEGVLLADALAWEGAELGELSTFLEVPGIEQLAWRGVLRRICEQAEHVAWLRKSESRALRDARAFQRAIGPLAELFR